MFIYQVEGNLMLLKGKIKLTLGKLTDNQFYMISGKRDQLTGKIQIQYGISLNEAKIVSRWNVPIHWKIVIKI